VAHAASGALHGRVPQVRTPRWQAAGQVRRVTLYTGNAAHLWGRMCCLWAQRQPRWVLVFTVRAGWVRRPRRASQVLGKDRLPGALGDAGDRAGAVAAAVARVPAGRRDHVQRHPHAAARGKGPVIASPVRRCVPLVPWPVLTGTRAGSLCSHIWPGWYKQPSQ